MAIGLETTLGLAGISPYAPTAAAFQEGETSATNILANQLRQQQAEQAMQQSAQKFPLEMREAGLRLGALEDQLRLAREQQARTEQAYGMPAPFAAPGGRTPGSGLMDIKKVPAEPAGPPMPAGLAPTTTETGEIGRAHV